MNPRDSGGGAGPADPAVVTAGLLDEPVYRARASAAAVQSTQPTSVSPAASAEEQAGGEAKRPKLAPD